jgi:hypothetical protein
VASPYVHHVFADRHSFRRAKKGKNIRPCLIGFLMRYPGTPVAHCRAVFALLIFSLFPNFVSCSSCGYVRTSKGVKQRYTNHIGLALRGGDLVELLENFVFGKLYF